MSAAPFAQSEVEALAAGFSTLVRAHLADSLDAIRAKNSDPKNLGCCATHDYCDANMLMADAFRTVVGRDIDLNDDRDTNLWNAAWDHAKAAEFREVTQ